MSHIQTNFTAASMAGIAKDIEEKIVKPVAKTVKATAVKVEKAVVEEVKKIEETVVASAEEVVSEVETGAEAVVEDVVENKAE